MITRALNINNPKPLNRGQARKEHFIGNIEIKDGKTFYPNDDYRGQRVTVSIPKTSRLPSSATVDGFEGITFQRRGGQWRILCKSSAGKVSQSVIDCSRLPDRYFTELAPKRKQTVPAFTNSN